ncbi:MAG TPA: N-acetylmuramoyl-L-alanine amidase [Candidatus Paceibacterota bacterium]|nr:N-acetylmuramoyl-L-alanine amidase [Candidatus Paceibacterota bacterium]
MNMQTFTRVGALLLIATFALAPSHTLAATKKSKSFPVTASATELRDAYEDEEIRILIVPGHEPGYGGAVFMGVYEREIVVDIANQLAAELRKDGNIDEVIVARTNTAWHKDLKRYFDRNMKKIERFVEDHKKEMQEKLAAGAVRPLQEGSQVEHAKAPTDVALRLYGINKWANENKIDLVINLHINDAPDHGPTTPGANSGYAIYIPDPQFGNGKASRPVAEAIAERLNDFSATSTLRIENKGVAEDQTLIAVGSNNTLEVPTVLIEYGYITESKMLAPVLRKPLATDYAHQTYLGLVDFLTSRKPTDDSTKILPYSWKKELPLGSTSVDAYALQVALRTIGLYPPSESDLVSCPISGIMNECTQVALKAYQKREGLRETGMLDARTRSSLNARFGK